MDSGLTVPNNDDTGERVVIDRTGNIVIAGRAGRFAETARVLVAALDGNGALRWRRVIDATAPAIFDGPLFLGLDGTGNVLLAWQEPVWSGGAQTDAPLRLAKLSADGSDIWRATYDPADFVDLEDVAVTADGGFVFVGTSSGMGNAGLALTVKIRSSGAIAWEDRFTSGKDRAAARAVAVDASTGDLIVGGSSVDAKNKSQSLLVRYDSNGRRLWSKQLASDRAMDEDILDVAFAPNGNIFASGRRLSRDVFHIQGLVYEVRGTNGKLDWSRFSDPALPFVELNLVRVDASGNAVVAGSSRDLTGTASDGLVARFLADGTPVWTQAIDLRPEDVINGLALDAAGNAFTTGYATHSSANPTVWVTSRFDATTGHAWDVTLDVATYDDWDKGLDIALTPAGEIVVTGRTLNVVAPSTFSGDATTIKYTQQ